MSTSQSLLPGSSVSVVGLNAAQREFGYAIAKESLSRRPPSMVLLSEDNELGPADRTKAISRARELRHDFALVSWAIRKHVDYVANFTFQSQTDIPELDRQIERIIHEAGKRGNFEVTGRHSLNEFMRINEACRTIDGDVGTVFLADGRVQAIEGDRVRNPPGVASNNPDWTHGVKTDKCGAPLAYAVHARRRGGNFEFERMVDARNFYLHGYFNRFDQVRGIGLLVSAGNAFQDVGDSFDFALAKAKAMQLFGLKFKRSADADVMGMSDEDKAKHDEAQKQRRLALRGKASYLVELMPDEDIDMIQDQQPSNQFQDYTKLMIMVALKSLDMYYSMFDESHTNFFGSRAGIVQYVESCKPKREGNQNYLDHWTRWKLAMAIMQGRLVLPFGWTVDDLWFEWVPKGLPWWKADEEAKGLLMTVTSGFDSYSGACASLGKDFKDIIIQRKKDEAFARLNDVVLPTMTAEVNLNINQ